jgi:hypothetical protein
MATARMFLIFTVLLSVPALSWANDPLVADAGEPQN